MEQQDQLKYENVDSLPVKNRKKTDFFCAIFFSAYVILLAIILIFCHKQQNLNKITYPNDAQGALCGYDLPNYPYLYYTSLKDPTKRLCVNACPKGGETMLSCKPTTNLACKENTNPKYEVTIYDSYLDEGRIGLFCLPTDPALKQQVLQMSGTDRKYAIYSVMDSFWTASWIAGILGVTLFFISHFKPYKMVPWIIFLGGIFSIIFSIFALVFLSGYFIVKFLIFCLFLLFGIMSLKTVFEADRRREVVVCSRLIHGAALTHNSREENLPLAFNFANIKNLGKPLLLILVFLIVYFLFFFLNIKEVLSVWSAGKLQFVPDRPFYTVVGFGSNFLMVLVGIQVIWGAFFIKESFNFIAACHSVYWYFNKSAEPSYIESTELFMKYHWGSVVGGSLLQGFFYFIDLVFNFFFDNQAEQAVKDDKGNTIHKHYNEQIGYDRTIDTTNSTPCKNFFDLVRGQALAYVALTNQNYCNSARACELLSLNSPFYDYSQITNRILRLNLHVVPIFIVLCISIIRMGSNSTPYAIIIISVLTFFIITYLLSYHGQKSEGLLISTFVDEALNNGSLKKAPQIITKTYQEELSYKHEKISFATLLFDQTQFAFE